MKRIGTLLVGAALIMPSLAVMSAYAAGGPGAHGQPPPANSGQADVCAPSEGAYASCLAKRVTQSGSTRPLATTSFQYGYTPADLTSAYNLPASASTGIIAIVDAQDAPNAESDLNAYRQQFGLGACTSTSPTPCFTKVDQNGGTNFPAPDVGWAQEISLDLDMASAVCPSCKILLVEANSSSLLDLGQGVKTAVALGAAAVSNSYGTNSEFSGETSYDTYYNHPGVMITVASGDAGYNRFGYPAASPWVTAVGGTKLVRSSTSRGWTETAWTKAGSGCSRYEPRPQPAWQTDSGCSRRTVADVSAVADPNTGVAVYDSYGSSGGANWLVFGGTSVSSPIIAAVYTLAGNGAELYYGSYPYAHRSSLNDVTSGKTAGCRPAYLCTAGVGYDGPTGLGTPNGLGAF